MAAGTAVATGIDPRSGQAVCGALACVARRRVRKAVRGGDRRAPANRAAGDATVASPGIAS